eukprot:CAMPEP_0115008096 /NCGR_PEP_ID=MMETSP0216-20121206/21670_1 /TAXON_ID=223996 /ORGANISM="Protocruzia adherens, Strain Boccale" /LENGTH=243 /DNA_ID=CAMNT_0002375361 /DNA_START=185 /DNA_END=916 /DNA_ORIENTATION=-
MEPILTLIRTSIPQDEVAISDLNKILGLKVSKEFVERHIIPETGLNVIFPETAERSLELDPAIEVKEELPNGDTSVIKKDVVNNIKAKKENLSISKTQKFSPISEDELSDTIWAFHFCKRTSEILTDNEYNQRVQIQGLNAQGQNHGQVKSYAPSTRKPNGKPQPGRSVNGRANRNAESKAIKRSKPSTKDSSEDSDSYADEKKLEDGKRQHSFRGIPIIFLIPSRIHSSARALVVVANGSDK